MLHVVSRAVLAAVPRQTGDPRALITVSMV